MSAAVSIAIIDPETWTMTAQNASHVEHFGKADGKRCFEVLSLRDSPCPFCPLRKGGEPIAPSSRPVELNPLMPVIIHWMPVPQGPQPAVIESIIHLPPSTGTGNPTA